MPEQIENRMVVDSQWEDIEKEISFEREVKFKCDLCGGNIYYADRCYEINGNIVCDREECTNVAKEELLEEHVMIVF